MGYKQEGKFGGRPKFGRSASRPKFGDGPRTQKKGNFELFDARCAKCGKDCQVPFKPTQGKPVLCRDCFGKNDSRDSREMRPKAPQMESSDLDEIHEKLDKIMRALNIE